jgi:hypothetical protein
VRAEHFDLLGIKKMPQQERRESCKSIADCGPQEPDPKLPESIRKNYHPGWGHLGSFPMKVVVSRIESVAPTEKQHSE